MMISDDWNIIINKSLCPFIEGYIRDSKWNTKCSRLVKMDNPYPECNIKDCPKKEEENHVT